MPGKTKAVRVQHGALPYRMGPDGALEILLVTSRGTRRWIIPEGWPIKGLKPSKSAAREAYEEAGVRGAIGSKAIGSFIYDKGLEDGVSVPCEVGVFLLKVERRYRTWPEAARARDPVVRPRGGAGPAGRRRAARRCRRFVGRLQARKAASEGRTAARF